MDHAADDFEPGGAGDVVVVGGGEEEGDFAGEGQVLEFIEEAGLSDPRGTGEDQDVGGGGFGLQDAPVEEFLEGLELDGAPDELCAGDGKQGAPGNGIGGSIVGKCGDGVQGVFNLIITF